MYVEENKRDWPDEFRQLCKEWALPRRQQLERDHPEAFLSAEEVRALPPRCVLWSVTEVVVRFSFFHSRNKTCNTITFPLASTVITLKHRD